ncbi:hypothetical protein [Flavobacterium orientale]|uniref:Uncharacterized protein n=1 Tax=Flavobacterium orientale TaxID=1756020 RepID=A0A916XWW2_9FLAO|nr:hypothetical protein [Flavobacterium orientale]GGD16281.1 hypothetical protein GCM10011343_03980 [Flavobacterium orientale]
MELKPKFGFEQLLFGMKQKDVEKVYGKPDVVFKDEDGNQIALYFKLKARLTFYEDEDFKLGYCIISNQNLTLFDEKIIGRPTSEVISFLTSKGFKTFEQETFDSVTNYFNEDNWLIIQSEFDEVIKVEMGAIVKNQDEFDWKF